MIIRMSIKLEYAITGNTTGWAKKNKQNLKCSYSKSTQIFATALSGFVSYYISLLHSKDEGKTRIRFCCTIDFVMHGEKQSELFWKNQRKFQNYTIIITFKTAKLFIQTQAQTHCTTIGGWFWPFSLVDDRRDVCHDGNILRRTYTFWSFTPLFLLSRPVLSISARKRSKTSFFFGNFCCNFVVSYPLSSPKCFVDRLSSQKRDVVDFFTHDAQNKEIPQIPVFTTLD